MLISRKLALGNESNKKEENDSIYLHLYLVIYILNYYKKFTVNLKLYYVTSILQDKVKLKAKLTIIFLSTCQNLEFILYFFYCFQIIF